MVSINNVDENNIDQIILTASGGPFFKKGNLRIKKTPKLAVNHPTWRMGKKNIGGFSNINE